MLLPPGRQCGAGRAGMQASRSGCWLVQIVRFRQVLRARNARQQPQSNPTHRTDMQRLWIGIGSFVGLTAVAMAAVAAHGLSSLDPTHVAMVRNALQMQGWHALALLACGVWAPRGG